MAFSEHLKTRVVSVYSRGNTTMCEVAETSNVSLEFVHNVVLVVDSSAGLPTRIPQAYMDGDGYSIQSTRYLFEMIEIDPSTHLDELER